eukprot:7103396-Karenia_brevis.AAC.1
MLEGGLGLVTVWAQGMLITQVLGGGAFMDRSQCGYVFNYALVSLVLLFSQCLLKDLGVNVFHTPQDRPLPSGILGSGMYST